MITKPVWPRKPRGQKKFTGNPFKASTPERTIVLESIRGDNPQEYGGFGFPGKESRDETWGLGLPSAECPQKKLMVDS